MFLSSKTSWAWLTKDLGAVHMGGETGRFSSRISKLFICLYRQDRMFAGTGRFSFQVYMRMFLPGTICKVSIISSRQSSTFAAGQGRKTSRQTFFRYKLTLHVHGEIPFNVPSCLPYKQRAHTTTLDAIFVKLFSALLAVVQADRKLA